ncbi:MAG: membrane integrity-associated transporter subunit PqiC [Candidatus Binatia bacterium]
MTFSPVAFAMMTIAGLLTGCSPVTHYYTLSQVESVVPREARPAAPSALVGIGPVELPDYVNIPQIVVRTGANTLDQATFDQWGGSLDDMVPRVLVDDLATRLPADHFVMFPQSGDLAFDYRVPVLISQFDVSSAGEAVVSARWQVRGKAGSGLVVVRETSARAQADGPSYQARVAALSKAVALLADDIAKTLAPLPRGDGKPRKK